MESRSKLMRALYRGRVRAGLVFLPAILIVARPVGTTVGIGLALCALGLGIRAWAAGHIKKEKELAVSGPYQYTRNPLYLGNFVLGLSVGIGTGTWAGVLLIAAYFLMFYPPVILEERDRMKRLFPEAYEEYKRNVPIFFPTFRPFPGASGAKFSAALYKKNREQRALIGSGVVWTILIAKMLLF